KRVLFVSFVKKVKKAIEFNAGPDLAMDYPIFLCAKLEQLNYKYINEPTYFYFSMIINLFG
ncbi:hypothetical protein, partial [Tetragenococcus halophilus]|uniref:hypothetical protein n=1 Tax=Tetragenococcus halophilus TaxID=51669 RepID=UPI001F2FD6A7